jgi:hypothetical protein
MASPDAEFCDGFYRMQAPFMVDESDVGDDRYDVGCGYDLLPAFSHLVGQHSCKPVIPDHSFVVPIGSA